MVWLNTLGYSAVMYASQKEKVFFVLQGILLSWAWLPKPPQLGTEKVSGQCLPNAVYIPPYKHV